ncbi:MAG: hypothetical protein ABI671_12765 [Burkholderiales bacterium]
MLVVIEAPLDKPDGAAADFDRNRPHLESVPHLPGQPEPAFPTATIRSCDSSLRLSPWIVCSLAPIKWRIAEAEFVLLVCHNEQSRGAESARLAIMRRTGFSDVEHLKSVVSSLTQIAKELSMTTYQGGKARLLARDFMSAFAVSRIDLDTDGRVTQVVWGVIDKKSNRWVSDEELAPVADVVAAIQNGDQVLAIFPPAAGKLAEREFVVVEFDDGMETIELDEVSGPAPRIHDMGRIDLHR